MRILVLTSSYPRFLGDGTAPFVQSISRHLVQLGHHVEVVAPYDAACRGSDDELTVHRFRYAPREAWHILGHARSLEGDIRLRGGVLPLLPFFLLRAWVVALATARIQKSEIVHAHWVLPGGLVGALVARHLRVPLIVSLHGSDVYLARRVSAFGRVARWVLRQATVITACSETLKEGAIALGADERKVHLLAWGADPHRFSPRVLPLDRSAFGLAPDAFVAVSLGRMVPKKGFDVLLRACARLSQEGKHVQLVIGGEGPQRAALSQMARELNIAGQVHLPGQIPWDDVPAFLNMGDIFVLPSVRDAAGNVDGLPTVLLEAMASEMPVVATDIAGIPLVIEPGVNGLICPPGDPQCLAEAIQRVMDSADCGKDLGTAARRAVETRYNWLEVARTLLSFVEPAAQSGYVARAD